MFSNISPFLFLLPNFGLAIYDSLWEGGVCDPGKRGCCVVTRGMLPCQGLCSNVRYYTDRLINIICKRYSLNSVLDHSLIMA